MNKKLIILLCMIFMITGSSTLAGMNVTFTTKDTVSSNAIQTTMLKGDEFDMVIIAPIVFSDATHAMITHKNNHNVRTFLKTAEEIYAEYNGRDEAEKIKYFRGSKSEAMSESHILLTLY